MAVWQAVLTLGSVLAGAAFAHTLLSRLMHFIFRRAKRPLLSLYWRSLHWPLLLLSMLAPTYVLLHFDIVQLQLSGRRHGKHGADVRRAVVP